MVDLNQRKKMFLFCHIVFQMNPISRLQNQMHDLGEGFAFSRLEVICD